MQKTQFDTLFNSVSDSIGSVYDVIGLHIEDMPNHKVDELLKKAKEKLNALENQSSAEKKNNFFSIIVLSIIAEALESELLRECYNKED